MRMKKINITFFLLFIILNGIYSQSKKNSFYIHYTPQITKTDFNQILINNPGGFIEFYETVAPEKAIGGRSFGAGYSRKFGKYSLGIYFQKNIRGQKSDFAYNYRGLIPLDTADVYGGLYNVFKMESTSFGLTFERQLLSRPKFYSAFQMGLGLDIYENAYLKDYLINVQTGALRRGCCLHGYSQTAKGGINNFTQHFKDGFYRAELSFSVKNLFHLTQRVGLEISPQFFILSKILKDSKSLDHSVPDGKIISGGVKFGVHYHF